MGEGTDGWMNEWMYGDVMDEGTDGWMDGGTHG